MEFLNAIPMDTSQLFEIGLQWGGTLLSALAVLVFGMWVAKRLTQWATSLLHRKSMDEAAAGFVGQIAYAILVVMVLLTALDQLGVNTTHQSLHYVTATAGAQRSTWEALVYPGRHGSPLHEVRKS